MHVRMLLLLFKYRFMFKYRDVSNYVANWMYCTDGVCLFSSVTDKINHILIVWCGVSHKKIGIQNKRREPFELFSLIGIT